MLKPPAPLYQCATSAMSSTTLLPVPPAPPTPPFRTSSFLLLPAELRNVVYVLVLTSPYITRLRRLSNRNYCSDYVLPALNLAPLLLATCRQIHAEASPVLYGGNTFAAHPSLLTAWPFLVKSSRPVACPVPAARIRKWYINVRLDTDPQFSAAGARKAFSGADELEIEVFQAQYGSCEYGVLRLFDQVRGVSKARVYGSVKEGFAKWLAGVVTSCEGVPVPVYDELLFEGASPHSSYDLWTHGGR
ncbi:hypothetical protein LTR60_001759 [Cryomyces antarcticus]|nr:hypothetical protein LTR60_001759 [Cryomyces antarcticus]